VVVAAALVALALVRRRARIAAARLAHLGLLAALPPFEGDWRDAVRVRRLAPAGRYVRLWSVADGHPPIR
jgi:hypothetical protein